LNLRSSDVFEANRARFRSRFPDLSRLLGLDDDGLTDRLASSIPNDFNLVPTQSGVPTISVRGIFIQSRVNPARDAERSAAALTPNGKNGYVFAGAALGLVPERYGSAFPREPVVIIEPDIYLFLLFLAARPLDTLFDHENLAFLVGTTAPETCAFLERLSLHDLPVYENPAITGANKRWFAEFAQLRARNREKREINANTLRRFGGLWLSNMCKNLGEMRSRDGIQRLKDAFAGYPALVLAAGPSLDRVLPRLAELRKRCLVIAVDTAVRACVRAGVEPDFIVLVDPQYWNWRHLDGVSCPKSALVTESAAWPAVFRFPCRDIVLCSSLFPLGRFLETRTTPRGELGAGGSVSTTAWDFARFLGCREVYMAALDLGFPDLKTHFTGSIFEDRTHTVSTRLAPAETAGYLALYGAGPYPVSDYRGGTVLTDKRLNLYAWWFESRLAQFPECRTATITSEGVKIPGFSVSSAEALIARECVRDALDRILDNRLGARSGSPDTSAAIDASGRAARFDEAFAELIRSLGELRDLARKGQSLCEAFIRASPRGDARKALLGRLNGLDRKILGHPAKEITAMVFSDSPGERQGSIEDSVRMYAGIEAAVMKNLGPLSEFAKENGICTDTLNVG
jgi:hypothetical protein